MASRPDYLKSYDAQSFPTEMARNSPFVPPADYPVDALMLKPTKPRTPPSDYSSNGQYPFRSYGDGLSFRHSAEVVRTTAEANQNQFLHSFPEPDYPAPAPGAVRTAVDNYNYNKTPTPSGPTGLYRRHTTHGPESANVRSPSGVNKAFLHHMKNFDRFSTIKGRGACTGGCPICNAITAATVALTGDDTPSPGNTPPIVSSRSSYGPNDKTGSPFNQHWAKNYPINAVSPTSDLLDDDDDPEAYQKERRQKAFLLDLTKRRAKVARVVADRVFRHVRELTVTKGEYLEILDDTRRWWACSNVSGQLGYVPSAILVSVAFDGILLTGGSQP